MKKIIISISSIFLACILSVSLATIKTVHSSKIHVQTYRKILKHPIRKIHLKYSLLAENNKATRHLNAIIQTMMQRRIRYFLTNSKHAVMNFTSSLKINDAVYFYKSYHLISIQYQQFLYFAGQAHPNTTYFVINYDIASGKRLRLKDILVNPRRDLQYISHYCIRQLSRKNFGVANFVKKGAGPEFKNYQTWNFTNKGLLITFNNYQVAAYAYGPQKVLIPHPLLKGRIKTRYYHR